MISVFTPTYNRGNLLKKLYKSLESQSYRNFEWIIVDDGSIDDTLKIVKEIKECATFQIIYKKKCNEGKHIAINEGCKLANGEWFFIVDSDDYLTEDALNTISDYCDEIKDNEQFAGVVGLRGSKDGNAWTQYYKKDAKKRNDAEQKYLEKEYIDANYIEYKYLYNISGDRAEVVKTEVLKKYPFPKFKEEKFLVESYLWLLLAKDGYKFRWFNKVIYITEYLEDGLTKNIADHYKNSPIGSHEVAYLQLEIKEISIKKKIKAAYNYFKYGYIAYGVRMPLVKKCNNKFIAILGLVLSVLKK